MEDVRTVLFEGEQGRGDGSSSLEGRLHFERLVPGGAEGSAEDGGGGCGLAVDDDHGEGVWEAEELALDEAGGIGDWRGVSGRNGGAGRTNG
jgi:hypothetical protein